MSNKIIASFSIFILALANVSSADSINSPNITMNVDTNRSTGNGAGNVAVTINTITVAETTLPEYSSGNGKSLKIKVRPGYQFDSTSNVTIQSATIGFNGGAINAVASVTPTGAADEELTFNLTSGTNVSVQDIARINGVKLKIRSAAGAAGPAQTTIAFTSAAAGGAFTNQGIVAANITRGLPDHLEFSNQPGNSGAGLDIIPAVKMVDFGGNIVNNDARTITLALQANPGSDALQGNLQRTTSSGIATWDTSDDLRLTNAASGYTLLASHSGAGFLTSDTATSSNFAITAGNPGGLSILTQPTDTTAGGDIEISVQLVDEFDNPTTTSGVAITLDSALNPGGWPLLVDTSLTKNTVNGVAQWTSADHLRINKAISEYKLGVSGLGAPVATDSFAINVGAESFVRFVQQPSESNEEQTVSPEVSAEITDAFGNRTTSTRTIVLTPSVSKCSSILTGNSAEPVAGLAAFSTLVATDPCEDTRILANASGLVGAISDEVTFHAKNEFPIAIKAAQLKRGKLFKFNAPGTFTLPTSSTDDPTKKGAVLTVRGANGLVRYALPKGRWRKINNKEFRFSNSKCEKVSITKRSISAVCEGRTGSVTLPESELDILLQVGKGTAKFCGTCGGTSKGNESDKLFNRTDCAKEAFCP